MKKFFVLAALLLAACSAEAPAPGAVTEEPALAPVSLPMSDQAGNRMEALTQNQTRWCTGDETWCVEGGETRANVLDGEETIILPAGGEVWPAIVRIGGDSALVGLITSDNQMYSGGGAQTQQLVLYEVGDSQAREMVRLPYSGSVQIRACFSEEDEQQRDGACHDLYTFVSRVSLDQGVASGAPRLVLETAAGTFPGSVTRNADSLERAPLQESDLVWGHDGTCSYRRVYARGADGLYAPDQPVPACSDYLEP
jgi:hypothetical protein